MKSLILYPENDRYVLKRIFKIFNSQNIKVDASMINRSWTLDQLATIYSVLDNYTHLIIIISSECFKEAWLAGLLGYLSGSNKGCFFYFTENDDSNFKLFSKYPNGQGYNEVQSYAEIESVRWSKVQKKEEARNHLIDMGFALSDDSLGECIVSGHVSIVKKYIDAGFSCSTRNSKGVPVLCLAIRSNHLEIVKFLIDLGADINAISDDRNNTPIMDASSSGYMDSVKLLVSEGADLECQSKNGQTALILAVGHGDIELSNYLLSAGADYEIKDFLGMSAKAYAKLFNKPEILESMI
ncbi:MAG: ankyrin repeat domain-containing protein [Spirochaetaceae bacterium]